MTAAPGRCAGGENGERAAPSISAVVASPTARPPCRGGAPSADERPRRVRALPRILRAGVGAVPRHRLLHRAKYRGIRHRARLGVLHAASNLVRAQGYNLAPPARPGQRAHHADRAVERDPGLTPCHGAVSFAHLQRDVGLDRARRRGRGLRYRDGYSARAERRDQPLDRPLAAPRRRAPRMDADLGGDSGILRGRASRRRRADHHTGGGRVRRGDSRGRERGRSSRARAQRAVSSALSRRRSPRPHPRALAPRVDRTQPCGTKHLRKSGRPLHPPGPERRSGAARRERTDGAARVLPQVHPPPRHTHRRSGAGRASVRDRAGGIPRRSLSRYRPGDRGSGPPGREAYGPIHRARRLRHEPPAQRLARSRPRELRGEPRRTALSPRPQALKDRPERGRRRLCAPRATDRPRIRAIRTGACATGRGPFAEAEPFAIVQP